MRRSLAVVAALLVIGGAAAALIARGGGDPPSDRAATLVPADALGYLHLSTDPDREADAELLARLNAFPAVQALRRRAVRTIGRDFDLGRDVRPWLGSEVAIALIDTGEPRADTLLLAATRDRGRAEALLDRAAGAQVGSPYRGVEVKRFGGVAAAFVKGFLAIGQESAVHTAIDRAQGRGETLAASAAYARASAGRPDGRVLDAYLPTAGVRRVLSPAPGLLGALGALLDHPALSGVSLSLRPVDEGLSLHARQVRAKGRPATFAPELLDEVPGDAALYGGLAGLASVGRLVPPATARQLRRRMDRTLAGAGLDLDRDVLRPLRGEVAVSLTPGLPVPTLTLVARTSDERRTREALARLQQPLSELLAAPAEPGGPQPSFEQRELGDVPAFVLPVTRGVELAYAVAGGRLIVSTQLNGVGHVLADRDSLGDTERFETVVPEQPNEASAVVFLDLSKLLALAEAAGLTGDPAVAAVRDDLRRLRAVGAVVRREETDTTAELFFEIP